MQFYFAFHLVCIIFVPDNFSIRKIQMMKRQGNILISLILVLMMVYLGAGTVIMQCLHNNTISVGMTDDCCKAKKGSPTGQSCMKMTTVKLSPTVTAKPAKADFTPLLIILPFIFAGVLFSPLMALAFKDVMLGASVPHAPPRRYLAILHVLRI